MNFALTKAQHALWWMKLNNCLSQPHAEAPPELTSHHNCKLGHWLDTEGLAQYGHWQEIKQLHQKHQQLHQLGLEILRLRDLERIPEAREKLVEVLPLSEVITDLLTQIEQKVTTTAPR
ncbi:MAG: CZB domain-containing protein [Prochlorothrix sp.]